MGSIIILWMLMIAMNNSNNNSNSGQHLPINTKINLLETTTITIEAIKATTKTKDKISQIVEITTKIEADRIETKIANTIIVVIITTTKGGNIETIHLTNSHLTLDRFHRRNSS